MMSPDDIQTKQTSKDENQTSNNRKNSSTRPPEQEALRCPRCDSLNTKFCYFNNYSLTQPRHFCKTCRRYWTKGGALRSVPIGGGCRKNKKVLKSSPSTTTTSRVLLSGTSTDFKDYSTSSSDHLNGGLKFLNSNFSPAMDFQLGGLSFPRLQNQNPSILNSTLDPSGIITSNSLMGFNYHPLSLGSGGLTFSNEIQNNNLASSIESLSSINQDLHWKLQQQRLAMLFGSGETSSSQQKESCGFSSVPLRNIEVEKSQSPFLFQNLQEMSKSDFNNGSSNVRRVTSGETATEWFFGNSYTTQAVTPTPANSNSNGNENVSSWNNGAQAWSDLQQQQQQQYSGLP